MKLSCNQHRCLNGFLSEVSSRDRTVLYILYRIRCHQTDAEIFVGEHPNCASAPSDITIQSINPVGGLDLPSSQFWKRVRSLWIFQVVFQIYNRHGKAFGIVVQHIINPFSNLLCGRCQPDFLECSSKGLLSVEHRPDHSTWNASCSVARRLQEKDLGLL